MAPVIDERDEFMARALAAAALGRPEGLTPALVATAPAAGSDVVWRYCMPAGGAESVCPPGRGDGAYAPAASVRVVVGVVGTAHVRGIARRWQEAQRDVRLDQLAR
jgi:pheromone shutdown protein TraB